MVVLGEKQTVLCSTRCRRRIVFLPHHGWKFWLGVVFFFFSIEELNHCVKWHKLITLQGPFLCTVHIFGFVLHLFVG